MCQSTIYGSTVNHRRGVTGLNILKPLNAVKSAAAALKSDNFFPYEHYYLYFYDLWYIGWYLSINGKKCYLPLIPCPLN